MNFFGGECQICLEKERLISTLKAQIDLLTRLALPSRSQDLSFEDREMQQILNGSQETIPISQDEIGDEANRILTGMYEDSQVEKDF